MENVKQDKSCSYRLLDNGIHEFVFHESSRAAVDTYISRLYQLLSEMPADTMFLTLVDARAGIAPLSYITQRLKEVEHAFPDRTRARTASLLPDSPLVIPIVR